MRTRLFMAFLAATATGLVGCGGSDGPIATDQAVAQNCAAIAGSKISPSQIGVGSSQAGMTNSGATVTASVLVAASAPMPSYCKVTGSIAAAAASAPSINFQINLPANWNGKALQYGGSGLNGTVVTALAPLPSASPLDTSPLARGYMTLGSDSGHQGTGFDGSFALNDEALLNFAYAQMKKTRDVALVLAGQLFQREVASTKVYFVGSSEGGREALMVAQRFPADYAGVVARVPVIQYTALQVNGSRISTAVRQVGAWMNNAQVASIHAATLASCDAADNLTDGVIGRPFACSLSAAAQQSLGLSNAQLNVLQTVHTPLVLGFPLASGNSGYPAFQWGAELSTSSALPAGGFDVWLLGTAAPTAAGPSGAANLIGDIFVRNFVLGNPVADTTTFVPGANQARLQQLSAMLDGDNPDLSAFFARGGKMIIKEAGGDYAHNPYATIDYVNRVISRDATAAAAGLRFYVNPMVDHSGTGAAPDSLDLLTLLENWVEAGQPPADALVVSRYVNGAVPLSRPMCRYPTYARYSGAGDVNAASSFNCTTGP